MPWAKLVGSGNLWNISLDFFFSVSGEISPILVTRVLSNSKLKIWIKNLGNPPKNTDEKEKKKSNSML